MNSINPCKCDGGVAAHSSLQHSVAAQSGRLTLPVSTSRCVVCTGHISSRSPLLSSLSLLARSPVDAIDRLRLAWLQQQWRSSRRARGGRQGRWAGKQQRDAVSDSDHDEAAASRTFESCRRQHSHPLSWSARSRPRHLIQECRLQASRRSDSSRGQRSSASTPARQQRRSPTPESSFFSILSIPTHQLQRSPMTGHGLCVRPTQQLRRSTLTGFRINPSRLLRLDSRRCVSSTECAQPSAFSPIPTRQRQRSQPTDRTRLPDSAAAAQHADAVPHHPPFVCSSSTAATSVVDEDEYHRTRRLGVAAVAASRPSGASTPYGLSRLLSLPDLSAVESAALLSVARGAISPFRGQVHRPAATPAAADGHPATNNSTTCLRQRAASPATSGRARYRIFPLELAAVTARLLGSSLPFQLVSSSVASASRSHSCPVFSAIGLEYALRAWQTS
jgi:hypothetical protein